LPRILSKFLHGQLELGITIKNKIIPDRSEHLDFSELEPFNVDCPAAGSFFFLPYILESGIIDIVKKCEMPDSSDIGSTQACLSMLLLKLMGRKRLSHIGTYDREPGLGVFAGLNVLPKPTYMNILTYTVVIISILIFIQFHISVKTQRWKKSGVAQEAKQ